MCLKAWSFLISIFSEISLNFTKLMLLGMKSKAQFDDYKNVEYRSTYPYYESHILRTSFYEDCNWVPIIGTFSLYILETDF